jgi:VWFA-related protein
MSFIDRRIIADAPRPAVRSAFAIGGVVAVCLSGAVRSQEQPKPTFRTSTNLVVIDAVAVDGGGRHVRDLTAADFEVVQSGRTMPVRQVVYVESAAGATATVSPRDLLAAPSSAASAPSVRRPSIGDAPLPSNARVIAVVVDDLGLSFESTYTVRRALSKFVSEQVKPGDLVAVLRTSTGAGALQQFTTDPRLLQAAIERIRWTIFSRSGISAFTPIRKPDALGSAAAGSGTAEATDERTMEGLRTQMLAAGSLGALEFVIRGVESMPGRKSVVFVSEGMRLLDRPRGFDTAGSGRVWRAFTRVMDRANRAGVVVYTMDPRGLATGGLTAEDDPHPRQLPGGRGGGSLSGASQAAVLDATSDRHALLMDSMDSLTFIAEQTGGFAILNTNDLNRGFDRVLDDLAGYYLIGYEGVPDSVRSWDPGRVRVRVRRPGVRVRSRRALFGPADSDRVAEARSGDPLVDAAMSPFGANKIDVRVTGLFGHAPGKGSFLRSLFFIDPSAVEFVRGDGGRHVAQITLALLTFGEDGRITDHWKRLVDLQLEPDTYRRVRERGILYSASIPLKNAGGYQLRAAARDERTGAVGSSSQFVEVPRVGKGRLTISSIVMRSADAAAGSDETTATAEPVEGLGGAVFGEPWVRIFPVGSDAIYTYEIYDGVTDDRSTLTTTAVLLRDGRAVHEGPVSPLGRVSRGRSVRAVPVAGRLSFSGATPPGSYTLQITVAQVRNTNVVRRVHQWTTFEVR